jgi:hypothetical protein
MDTACSSGLQFHSRDTNLVTIDQSEWANARVGFGWQLRRGLRPRRLASADVVERKQKEKCPDNCSHGVHLGREG